MPLARDRVSAPQTLSFRTWEGLSKSGPEHACGQTTTELKSGEKQLPASGGPGTFPYLELVPPQGYQWLKDKILSEEGRRQQAKLKELQAIAERLGCTLPQLAIGNGLRAQWGETCS